MSSGISTELLLGHGASAPIYRAMGVLAYRAHLYAVTLSFVLLGLLIRTRASTDVLLEQRTDLRHLALHDPLTHLPNRRSLIESAERALARARRAGTTIAVLFIDLDGFKNVNDTLGHAAGDLLLRDIASELRHAAGGTSIVGRIGGDEFVVLLEGWTRTPRHSSSLSGYSMPCMRPARSSLRATASGGCTQSRRALGSPAIRRARQALCDADAAMYRAKSLGKNTCVAFEHAPSESRRCRNGAATRPLATAGASFAR